MAKEKEIPAYASVGLDEYDKVLRHLLRDYIEDFLYEKGYELVGRSYAYLDATETFEKGNTRLTFCVERGLFFSSIEINEKKIEGLDIRFSLGHIYKFLSGMSYKEFEEEKIEFRPTILFDFFKDNYDEAIELIKKHTKEKFDHMETVRGYREQHISNRRYQKWLELENKEDTVVSWEWYLYKRSSPLRVLAGNYDKLINMGDVNAIVNETNNAMCGVGGLDAKIHRLAGKELLLECANLRGCDTGLAKITNGYQIANKHIIHTATPMWKGGNFGESELLASCYRQCLSLALENRLQKVVFPVLGCYMKNFPLRKACDIAALEVSNFLITEPKISQVTFVCFDNDIYKAMDHSRSKLSFNTLR